MQSKEAITVRQSVGLIGLANETTSQRKHEDYKIRTKDTEREVKK